MNNIKLLSEELSNIIKEFKDRNGIELVCIGADCLCGD